MRRNWRRRSAASCAGSGAAGRADPSRAGPFAIPSDAIAGVHRMAPQGAAPPRTAIASDSAGSRRPLAGTAILATVPEAAERLPAGGARDGSGPGALRPRSIDDGGRSRFFYPRPAPPPPNPFHPSHGFGAETDEATSISAPRRFTVACPLAAAVAARHPRRARGPAPSAAGGSVWRYLAGRLGPCRSANRNGPRMTLVELLAQVAKRDNTGPRLRYRLISGN